jgi:Ca-activated chloride channel family protein
MTLTLTSTLNTNIIPLSAEPRLLYLLVEIGGGQAGAARLPVQLSLVVDKSDSMMIRIAPLDLQQKWVAQGHAREHFVDGVSVLRVDLNRVSPRELQELPRSINHVKTALRSAIEALGPADRCALIVFAGQAVQVLPLSSAGNPRPMLSAVDQIESMKLGDDTYMGRGMALGVEELQRGANPAAISRLIVLTDGFTLDEADCRALAQRAKAARISISTLGLGGSFNEDLLIPLADDTGGHAYNIEDPAEIPAVFQQELNAVQAIAYRHLDLKWNVSQGVQVRAAHRVRPVITHLGALPMQERSANVSLGDYELDAPPAVLLELLTPPKSAPGDYRLAQLLLAYDDPTGELMRQTVRQDIVVNYSTGPVAETHNPRVMSIVERVTASKLQTRALEDIQRGDIPGATRKLQAAATRLLDMGETELARTVQEQAQQLAHHGQVAPVTAKTARYKTRKLTQKLD